ncbi:MAG: type IV pilus assembly protein PilM [Hydrogenophilus sp.]|nr:type IV pilus assembly protein PilM [Hydrogenophilus sp.]
MADYILLALFQAFWSEKTMREWFQRQRRSSVVGVDFGPSAVKGVVLEGSRGRPRVVAAGSVALPVGCVDGSGLRQIEPAAAALTELRTQLGKLDRAVMALPDGGVIQRVIEIPSGLRTTEFEVQVRETVARLSPFPVEEMRIDWQRLDGEGKTERVLVVATREERVEAYRAVAELVGVTLLHLEVESFALRRAAFQEEDQGSAAILDLGHQAILFAVWDQRAIKRFERAQAFDTSEVRQILQRIGMAPTSQEDPSFSDWAAKIRRELRTVCLELADEVAHLLRFYRHSTQEGESVNRLLLAGGLAALPGMAELMTERAGLPAEAINPWAGWPVSAAASAVGVFFPRFVLATGLALRGLRG